VTRALLLATCLSAALALALAPPLPAAAAQPGFTIVLPESVSVAEKAATKVSLTIAPDPGRSVSRKGPLRVLLAAEPQDGLELPRRRYRRADAADALAESPRFDLAVRGRRAGRHTLKVTVRFWLCGRSTCWPVAAERSVPVEVTPAP
jgi:hypothetical protein